MSSPKDVYSFTVNRALIEVICISPSVRCLIETLKVWVTKWLIIKDYTFDNNYYHDVKHYPTLTKIEKEKCIEAVVVLIH